VAPGNRRRRHPLSLRARLVLSAAYLLLVVLVAIEVPLAISVERRSISEFGSIELGYAGLLSSRIADPVAQAAALTTEPPHPGQSLKGPVRELHAALPDVRILVVDVHRRVLYDSSGEFAVDTVIDTSGRPELASALQGEVRSEQRHSSTLGQDLLLVAVPVHEGTKLVGAVRLSEPLGQVRSGVHRTWLGLAGVGLTVLLVGLAVALVLATSLARPVRRLEEAARDLGSGNLGARATPEGPREIQGMARSFNEMADVLSTNLESQRDFLAYASHQLRTPLTGLTLRLEAIRKRRGDPVEQATRAQMEADRLASIVRDLLALQSASSVEPVGARIDLREISRRAVERWSERAQRSGKRLALHSDGPAWAWAAADDVEHILDNLLDNAVQYCPPGTAITVQTEAGSDGGVLVVADDGPGIPTGDRAKVFERFYRGTTGQHSGPGTGLGLSIVAQLVSRWGGEVRLADGHGGKGTRFEISLPSRPADS